MNLMRVHVFWAVLPMFILWHWNWFGVFLWLWKRNRQWLIFWPPVRRRDGVGGTRCELAFQHKDRVLIFQAFCKTIYMYAYRWSIFRLKELQGMWLLFWMFSNCKYTLAQQNFYLVGTQLYCPELSSLRVLRHKSDQHRPTGTNCL